jgi:hypothetical protein
MQSRRIHHRRMSREIRNVVDRFPSTIPAGSQRDECGAGIISRISVNGTT